MTQLPQYNSSKNDHPFGMLMPGRSYSSTAYKYGFNGQEKDDEVAGNGNINTAMFWEYDTRLGRRWNLDPKPNVWESLYSVMGDNPIIHTDINGDKWGDKKDKKEGEKRIREYSKIANNAENKYRKLSQRLNENSSSMSTGDLGKLNDKIAHFKEKAEMFKDLASGLSELGAESNPTIATFSPFTSSSGDLSSHTYMEKVLNDKGDVVNKIVIGGQDGGTRAHETKHAVDLNRGALRTVGTVFMHDKNSMPIGIAYVPEKTVISEINAYKIEFFYEHNRPYINGAFYPNYDFNFGVKSDFGRVNSVKDITPNWIWGIYEIDDKTNVKKYTYPQNEFR